MSVSDITHTKGIAMRTSSVRKTIIAEKKPGYAVDAGFAKSFLLQAVVRQYTIRFADATTIPTATVAKQPGPASALLAQVLAHNKQTDGVSLDNFQQFYQVGA